MPDAEFEKTFADLAHARLRDRAPGLLDYLVGFQLLDKSEDDTHAVGVWGFKVGESWMYNPVFFLNGQLKGDELLYVKDQDAFVPMNEKWVNYLLNRRPHVLGAPEEKKLQELGIHQPDFNAMARPPYSGSKYASVRSGVRDFVEKLAATVEPAFQPFLPVILSSPSREKRAELSSKWHLPNFIRKAGKKAAKALISTMRKNSSFADAILKFYSMDELIKAAEQAIGEGSLYKKAEDGDTYIEGTAPTVQVMLADKANVTDLGETMLTDAQKEQLQRDRYLVMDNRGPNDTAKVYATQISKTLQNPHCSSLCNVLTQGGNFKPMLVIMSPVGAPPYCHDEDRGKSLCVVVKMDGKRVRMVAACDIFTDNEGHDQEAWEEAFNGMADPGSVGERNKIVLVNENREGSFPFFIERKVTTADGQVRLYGEFDRYPSTDSLQSMKDMLRPKFRGRVFNQSDSRAGRFGCDVGGYDTCLVITKKDGAKITQIGKDYFVPNGMKALVLSKQDIAPYKLEPTYMSHRRTPDPDELANPQTIADIEMQLFKSGSVTKVQPISDGIEFWLRVNGEQSRPMSKLAALKTLIERHNMREKDAAALLKMAKRSNAPEYYVSKPQMRKQAQGDVPMPEVPYMPEPSMGIDPTIGVQTIYPQEDEIAAGVGSQPQQDLDMDATFRAEQAANQGQKEVMDTSVVGGLVKTMDPNAAIDGYISDLMLGLDRVGRILFMYYWHYEKFKERYGSQDMPELEDNLRNVFENMGDLTIFLKQKTVEPDVTDASAEAELSEVL